VGFLIEPFDSPETRLALLELLCLSVAAGLLGAHIVLRRIAFFTHGVGGATYPGVVLAGGLGMPTAIGALAAALAFAGTVDRLGRRARLASDAATALALIAALALGTLLAGDVFASPVSEEEALLGSLTNVGTPEVVRSAAAAAVAVAATAVLGRMWIAAAFDPEAARTVAGRRSALAEPALLAVLAVVAVAAVDAVGALLAGALLVVPAATARLLVRTTRGLSAAALGLAAVEGVAALWLSTRLDAPPGPTLAVLCGAVFAVVAIAVGVRRHRPSVATAASRST
jgi:ABC-type Mn2+/Zn2+ transport system permease subunit